MVMKKVNFKQGTLYNVYADDKRATVSFYPNRDLLKAMGFQDVFDMNDAIEAATFETYPGFNDKKIAQFDPESSGTMVYCATEEIAAAVEQVFFKFIEPGVLFLREMKEKGFTY